MNLHVSELVILAALQSAILVRTHAASSLFITPSNSRDYGCAVNECSRPAYAKGLCNAHYIRSRTGSPMGAPVRARKREGVCSQCGGNTSSSGGWGLCQHHYKKARYETIKDAAIAAMGGKCTHCGGTFHRSVFDFHHRGDKAGSPGDMIANKSLAELAKELSKCTLLCANCHRLEHHCEL